MGITALEPKRAPLRSTAASIALHALLALAIPSFAWTVATTPEIEALTLSKIQIVHVQQPRPQIVARPQAVAPERSEQPHLEQPKPAPAVHRVLQRRTDAPEKTFVREQAAPVIAAQPSGAAAATPTAASAAPQPTAQAEAPRQVATVVHRNGVGGYLPLGAEQQDPVLDPQVRASLVALGAHTTLTIVVDEDGKTKSVAFAPTIDAAIEAKIRTLLSDAQWDAAVCGGGVTCQGQAIIKL